ncbi:MAG: pyrroline-5-carboxylate reductase [Treponema sp.]|nr:pyrroline-5-carboxylate reductase [Treponema sp.]
MDTAVTVGCIGCGSMGSALVRAFVKKISANTITVSARRYEHARALAEETGCRAVQTNAEVAARSRYLFLAVKPAVVADVLADIKNDIPEHHVVISLAAGVSLEQLRSLTHNPVVRIMPNMAAVVAEGMTAICFSDTLSADDRANIVELLAAAGKTDVVDERLFDCVTAVSGSGIAYVCLFIEALADAAVRYGMTRAQAYAYAVETVQGTAELLRQTKRHPADLKDAVCSPGGTTIAAVAALEKAGFRAAIGDAVTAAYIASGAPQKQ